MKTNKNITRITSLLLSIINDQVTTAKSAITNIISSTYETMNIVVSRIPPGSKYPNVNARLYSNNRIWVFIKL
jgi:hypothetical protein